MKGSSMKVKCGEIKWWIHIQFYTSLIASFSQLMQADLIRPYLNVLLCCSQRTSYKNQIRTIPFWLLRQNAVFCWKEPSIGLSNLCHFRPNIRFLLQQLLQQFKWFCRPLWPSQSFYCLSFFYISFILTSITQNYAFENFG